MSIEKTNKTKPCTLFSRNHTEPHMQGFTCNHFRDQYNCIVSGQLMSIANT